MTTSVQQDAPQDPQPDPSPDSRHGAYAGRWVRSDAVTPTDRLLSASLLIAPLVYLAADSTYAVRGWDDATAGTLHVLGAIAYGFVVLWFAARLPAVSTLRAVLLLVGLLGLAGNVAYGFDAIHLSLGDPALVDQPGAANLIKPLGLCFPLSLALIAMALARLDRRWQAWVVLAAALAWPVAHIGNIAALAVAGNVALLVGIASLAWDGAAGGSSSRPG